MKHQHCCVLSIYNHLLWDTSVSGMVQREHCHDLEHEERTKWCFSGPSSTVCTMCGCVQPVTF